MLEIRKNGFVLTFLIIVLFSIISCDNNAPTETTQSYDLNDPEKRIQIVLRVQEKFYLNADFEEHLQLIAGEEFLSLDLLSLSRLFESFMEDKLLLAAAQKNGVSVSWQEQNQYLAKEMSELSLEGESPSLDEQDTKLLMERLLIEKYIYDLVRYINVEQSEISEYYEANKREFLQPERVSVSQILLETEEEAIETYDKLKGHSESEFQKIAKEVSSGIEASHGGHLGVFKMNQLPKEMEKVIFSLKEGQTSQVVESAYGFHIFRLDKKLRPELETMEKVSPIIRMKILDQKIKQVVSAHLLELKESLDWEFYPQNLSFPYSRNSNE